MYMCVCVCLCVYMCVCLCMSTERNTYYTYFNKSKNVLKLTYFWRQKKLFQHNFLD